MKLKDKFLKALEFKSSKDKVEHDSKILMFKFLSIVEEEMIKTNMTKKELANLLGTSPSYITQLFRGTKNINLLKIIELQNLFDLEFEITAKKKVQKRENKVGKTNRLSRKTLATAR